MAYQPPVAAASDRHTEGGPPPPVYLNGSLPLCHFPLVLFMRIVENFPTRLLIFCTFLLPTLGEPVRTPDRLGGLCLCTASRSLLNPPSLLFFAPAAGSICRLSRASRRRCIVQLAGPLNSEITATKTAAATAATAAAATSPAPMSLPGASSLPTDANPFPPASIATPASATSSAAAAAAAAAGVVGVRTLGAADSQEIISGCAEKRDDCGGDVEGTEAVGAAAVSTTVGRGPPGFSDLWESWKDAACCLHSLSKVACYPSATAVLGPALGVDLQEARSAASCLLLSPHFAAAGKTEYPNAKAVLSYRAFKKAGRLCPAFSRCFTASVFCEFLRDAHGDVSTQTAARNLLNSIFNVHLKEKVQPYLNDKEELTMESLALMFVGWAEDSAFPALFALKDEDEAAHPGILEFFSRFLAVRLFFVLDPGRRGFVRARDLLSNEDFQLLLNSLYKPLGSPLEDLPAQWSLQFAYDVFNFLREKDFAASRAVVAELLEALSAVVCRYTYDCTPAALDRLFASCTLLTWGPLQNPQEQRGPLWAEWPKPKHSMQQQQKQQQAERRQQEAGEDSVLCLSTEDLIRFLAALDFCAAVWGPTALKARVVSPACVSAALRFLWEALDVEAKGYLGLEDISELCGAVCETLNARGYPASSLLRGSLEAELVDRLQANSQSLEKRRCISNHTQGRMVLMFLLSPAFFQLFDQREHCPGAPLLPGDPVSNRPPEY
ncbi:hypothetical protein Esti_005083 [Eimeria stiedai]